MSRKALLVGINHYDKFGDLNGCIADAEAMRVMLARHEDRSINFDCQTYTSSSQQPITRRFLRDKIAELLTADFDGDALFYFSGHGTASETGGCLVTQDGEPSDYGIPMNELLTLANNSRAKSVLLILDCCFSGQLGNPANLQGGNQAQLREGLTILAASKATQVSMERGGHGVFTKLVLGALAGGAADVRGRVSAASVYAYVEEALNAWDQRPLYKSHANRLPQLRLCKPSVDDALLRELPQIFEHIDTVVPMDPSFEHSAKEANPTNVEIFDKFKCLRNARLLKTEHDKDLYYSALASDGVLLTPLGQFYWHLAFTDRI
jgi:Caspase domain